MHAIFLSRRTCNLRCLLLLLLLHIGWWSLGAFAFAQQDIEPLKAMQSVGSSQWYDRANDAYEVPTVTPEVDNALRYEGWIAEKANDKAKKDALAANNRTNTNWFSNLFSIDPNLFSSLVIGTLAAILVVVIVLLAFHSFRNYMPTLGGQKKAAPKEIQIDPARAEDLPFEAKQESYNNPLEHAKALMEAGDYNNAILLVYGYMLLVLDQARYISLQKGKTNRMYAREAKTHASLRTMLESAMLPFEDVYFGKKHLSRERFLAVWNVLPEFQQLASPRTSPEADRPVLAEAIGS